MDKGPKLIIKFGRFGPIKKVEEPFEIKPLTIFFGRNNTGKSYLAYAIWAIFEMPFIMQYDSSMLDIEIDNLDELIDAIKNTYINKENIKIKTNLTLKINTKELVEYLNLKIENSDDIYVYINDIELELVPGVPGSLKGVPHHIPESYDYYKIKKDRKVELKVDYELFDYIINKGDSYPLKDIFLFMSNEVLDIIVSYYFPASRSGLFLLRKYFLEKLITKELLPMEKRRERKDIPAPIIKFFTLLPEVDPQYEETPNQEYKEVWEFLEKEALRGEIVFNKKISETYFEPYGSRSRVPINLCSSSVVELSPLLLFIKYGKLVKNPLLIIEEPEIHLHPDAQYALSRAIIRLINKGVKVLLITHSPEILQELNNAIMCNYLFNKNKEKAKEFMEKYDWEELDLLDPEKTVAYIFDEESDGVVVRKTNIDKKYGIENKLFDKILKNKTIETSDLLELLDDE